MTILLRAEYWIVMISAFMANLTHSQTLTVSPNPFHSRTEWSFSLAAPDTVSLTVFNRWGQNVRTIYDKTFLSTGHYSDSLDMSDLEMNVYIAFLETTSGLKAPVQLIKTGPVGIAEYAAGNHITVYPNPSGTAESIKIQANPFSEGAYHYSVFDALGKMVAKGQLRMQSPPNELSLNLHPGIYTLLLDTEDLTRSFKIIKQ